MQWKFSGQAQVVQNSEWWKLYIQYKFRAHSFFQGKRKLLKNPQCKKYIQYSEKFQRTLFLSGQAQSCSKILNGKKYIQYSENFRINSVFQGKRNFPKNPVCTVKSIFQYSEKFRANSVFQGKRNLFKILNDKKSVTCRQGRQRRECLLYHNHEMWKTN